MLFRKTSGFTYRFMKNISCRTTWNKLMQLIEVQFGDYLGEDDIIRLEDRYGRD